VWAQLDASKAAQFRNTLGGHVVIFAIQSE
jgi:hypothetical protein